MARITLTRERLVVTLIVRRNRTEGAAAVMLSTQLNQILHALSGCMNPDGFAPQGESLSNRKSSGASQNAITHGLTATILLEEAVGPDVVERCRLHFENEWQPTGPTQEFLVKEMARHVSALELAARAETAVLRYGVKSAAYLQIDADTDCMGNRDIELASATTSAAVERICRYRRGHEKAFYAAFGRLRELKSLEQDPDYPEVGPLRSDSGDSGRWGQCTFSGIPDFATATRRQSGEDLILCATSSPRREDLLQPECHLSAGPAASTRSLTSCWKSARGLRGRDSDRLSVGPN